MELLIVVTIIFTAISNLFTSDEQTPGTFTLNFWYAAFFGLIHGMGFSNTLRSLLMGTENILWPLFSFNLGLELGQVVVVVIFMAITFMATNRLRVARRDWKLVCSGAIAGMALMILLERLS